MTVASKDVVVYCLNSSIYLSMDGVRKSYPDTDSVLAATASLPRPGTAVLITRSPQTGTLEVTDLLPHQTASSVAPIAKPPQEAQTQSLQKVKRWLDSIHSLDSSSTASI